MIYLMLENKSIRNKQLSNIIYKIEKMVEMLKNLNKFKRKRDKNILKNNKLLKILILRLLKEKSLKINKVIKLIKKNKYWIRK